MGLGGGGYQKSFLQVLLSLLASGFNVVNYFSKFSHGAGSADQSPDLQLQHWAESLGDGVGPSKK